MKALVALLGLFTASFLPGEAVITVTITAVDATGYLVQGNNVLRGTRLLLICDVEGLPMGYVVNSYRWEHSGISTGAYKIQRESPYYKPVNDTLLVDVTSWDNGRTHTCEVEYRSEKGGLATQRGFTAAISPSDSSTPFILTPTSLLLNHALITEAQQITGSNGQQWINCTRGGSGVDGRVVQILSVKNTALISRGTMTATIGPERNLRNGLYYCSDGQAPRHYISLFLKNSSNLPTPTIHALATTALGFTSPDGSRVERYILEFECRVRNITFVEKYMSVSASGGTGQVATSASCFGGLGQLYRVKVWAVSGLNISQPAVKLVNTVHGPTLTIQVLTSTPSVAGGTWSPGIVSTPTRSGTPTYTASSTPSSSPGPDDKKPDVDGASLTIQVLMSTSTTSGSTQTPPKVVTSTRSAVTSFTPSGAPLYTPENVDRKSDGDNTGRTFIGVGIGIFILLVVLALVSLAVVVVVVMVVKRRAPYKQKGKMRANSCYSSPVVVELSEKDLDADYDGTVETEDNGFNPYEDIDSKAQSRNAKTPPLKVSSTPVSATNVGELYAVVDKSKKKGVKKKGEEDGCIETNKDDPYTMPVKKKKNKVTDEGMGASGGADKSEGYNDVPELRYEPKADSESGMKSEGDERPSNADMLYAVVDKSQKRKK